MPISQRTRLFAAVWTLWLVAAACASSAHVAEGSRFIVRLYDARSNLDLALANASHPDFAGLYSQVRPSASVKLTPDDAMGALLEQLSEHGFDALADPVAPPPAAPGLRGWVTIHTNGTDRTLIVPSEGASADMLLTFAQLKTVISAQYAETGGLQHISNPRGPDLFDQEQRRLRGGP